MGKIAAFDNTPYNTISSFGQVLAPDGTVLVQGNSTCPPYQVSESGCSAYVPCDVWADPCCTDGTTVTADWCEETCKRDPPSCDGGWVDGSFPGVPDLGWIMPPPHTEDECLAAMTAAHPEVKYITFQGPGRTTGCGGHSGAYMGELDPSIAYRACAVSAQAPRDCPMSHCKCDMSSRSCGDVRPQCAEHVDWAFSSGRFNEVFLGMPYEWIKEKTGLPASQLTRADMQLQFVCTSTTWSAECYGEPPPCQGQSVAGMSCGNGICEDGGGSP